MRFYTEPAKKSDTYSLPNCEVFYSDKSDHTSDTVFWNEDDQEPYESGYYYWFCFPGCLPDSSPFGPFKTEREAITAAREDWSD